MASRKTKAGSTNSPDKKLPLNKSIPLGIQHVLAMFAGNITVPIIVAGVLVKRLNKKYF
jgi:xanthine/uracil permease